MEPKKNTTAGAWAALAGAAGALGPTEDGVGDVGVGAGAGGSLGARSAAASKDSKHDTPSKSRMWPRLLQLPPLHGARVSEWAGRKGSDRRSYMLSRQETDETFNTVL